MLTLLPVPYRIALYCIILAGCFGGGYFLGWRGEHDAVVSLNAQIAQQVKDQAVQVAAINAQHKIDLTNAEKQHGNDQNVIDDLTDKLGRVRIHIPACGDLGKGKESASSDGESRIFSARVDESFARLQAGVSGLIHRCDQLNIDAIRLNNSL